MDIWEDIQGLSPEEQTTWLKSHMRDWDGFVEGIRISDEQLAAHRAAGGTGLPPGWMWAEDYWKKRGLPNRPE
jgi:hypothetical protein